MKWKSKSTNTKNIYIENKQLSIMRRWSRERAQTTLSMDPRNDIGQQALDLTKLNVLWVQSLKHMSHGIHLLRCQVYRNRCSVRSSRWTSVTSSSASPRRNLKYNYVLLHGTNLILFSKGLLNCLLCQCNI